MRYRTMVIGKANFDASSMHYTNIILSLQLHNRFIYLFIYFIYNQIPPQSEENSILHKNSIDKILVKQVYLT